MSKSVSWGKNVYGMMRYMRKVMAGHYRLEWQGDVVELKREFVGRQSTRWWRIYVNGACVEMKLGLNSAMSWVDNVWGTEPVKTRNLLNPAAGEIEIPRKNVGGCCDPGTEQYHSM